MYPEITRHHNLLFYCFQFASLRQRQNNSDYQEDWLDPDEPFSGFTSWTRNHTQRISIWSDVFFADDTAIVLVELQAQYIKLKYEADKHDQQKLFAIGDLITSVLIWNNDGPMKETHFNLIQKSTEFAQIYQKNQTNFGVVPFQKLIVLCRDWEEDEHEFGFEGGENYIRSSLESLNRTKFMDSSFEETLCFLMPNLEDRYSRTFIENLKIFVESLFLPENILSKKVFGEVKKGRELYDFIKNQLQKFQFCPQLKVKAISEEIFKEHEKEAMKIYELERAKLFEKGTSADRSHLKSKETAEYYLKSYDLRTETEFYVEQKAELQKHIENSFENWKTSRRNRFIVIISSAATLFIISVCLICIISKRLRKYRKRRQRFDLANFDDGEYEIDKERIEQLYSIGSGNFGEVFKAILKSEKGDSEEFVALKMMKFDKPELMSDSEYITRRAELERKFIVEARTMTKFSTYHVMRLKGFWLRDKPYMMLMELAEHGDLRTFLLKQRSCSEEVQACNSLNYVNFTHSIQMQQLKTEVKCKPTNQIALEVADGMAYLESLKFVHRDLAARNCMVTSDLTVKIGDFGMSKDVGTSNYYMLNSKNDIPVRWAAPESLKDEKFSTKSDVFSFGVLLWEVVTFGEVPYSVSC